MLPSCQAAILPARSLALFPLSVLSWASCRPLPRSRRPLSARSFRRSAATKILTEVLEEKMAFTNERDKKGRLSFVYNSDDSAETIREIVEDCQKKVIGASHAAPRASKYAGAVVALA